MSWTPITYSRVIPATVYVPTPAATVSGNAILDRDGNRILDRGGNTIVPRG